jgi:hypothetical protein
MCCIRLRRLSIKIRECGSVCLCGFGDALFACARLQRLIVQERCEDPESVRRRFQRPKESRISWEKEKPFRIIEFSGRQRTERHSAIFKQGFCCGLNSEVTRQKSLLNSSLVQSSP